MKVEAIRTDEQLGITSGEIYNANNVKAMYGEVIMVQLEVTEVYFDEKNFKIVPA